MLRSCYSTRVNFAAVGRDPQRIQWFWAEPTALDLGIPSPFTSRNYLEKGTWPEIGEIEGARRPWRNGSFPIVVPGQHLPCGKRETWEEGLPDATPVALPRTDYGLAWCCFVQAALNGLPLFEWFPFSNHWPDIFYWPVFGPVGTFEQPEPAVVTHELKVLPPPEKVPSFGPVALFATAPAELPAVAHHRELSVSPFEQSLPGKPIARIVPAVEELPARQGGAIVPFDFAMAGPVPSIIPVERVPIPIVPVLPSQTATCSVANVGGNANVGTVTVSSPWVLGPNDPNNFNGMQCSAYLLNSVATFIQQAQHSYSTLVTTGTVSTAGNVTSGNLLILVLFAYQDATNAPVVTDSQGNTWHLGRFLSFANNAIFWAVAGTTGPLTVSMHNIAFSLMAPFMGLMEFNGPTALSALGGTANGSGNNPTAGGGASFHTGSGSAWTYQDIAFSN